LLKINCLCVNINCGNDLITVVQRVFILFNSCICFLSRPKYPSSKYLDDLPFIPFIKKGNAMRFSQNKFRTLTITSGVRSVDDTRSRVAPSRQHLIQYLIDLLKDWFVRYAVYVIKNQKTIFEIVDSKRLAYEVFVVYFEAFQFFNYI
jgi:hypothetical protein